LPLLFHFGEFAQKKGCKDTASCKAYIKEFVSRWLEQHGAKAKTAVAVRKHAIDAECANNCRRPITRLILSDLAAQRVLDFLHMIEVTRGNHVSTRNQRLAALHTFYRYLGLHYPEMLAEAQRVEAIPMKRNARPQTDYLEHDEIETLFKTLPRQGSRSPAPVPRCYRGP
jgi:site-specific recombinase XerD